MSRNNKLDYMPISNPVKKNRAQSSSTVKKKIRAKKNNNTKVFNLLYNLSVIIFILGAFELFGVVTWNALGGYDMSGIAIIKSIIPCIIALGVGLFLMHIIPDGKGVRK